VDVIQGRGSWADVAMNAAFLLLPAVGGAAAVKLIKKFANVGDSAGDVAKSANKVAKNADATKAVGKADNVGDAAKGAAKADEATAATAPTKKTKGQIVKANREKGIAAENEIADQLRKQGFDVNQHVTRETPFGRRVVDIEVWKDGELLGGIEVKTGGSRYMPQQRAADQWLNSHGYPTYLMRLP
jgi:hypothetical protein